MWPIEYVFSQYDIMLSPTTNEVYEYYDRNKMEFSACEQKYYIIISYTLASYFWQHDVIP